MASDTGGPRTLIVKALAPEVTEESFGTFFSDQGPVSRSFLVRQGKGGPHKGYGFVQFALASDAKQAAAILDGKRLEGHRIKVEFANKRASLDERKEKKSKRGHRREAPEGESEAPEPETQSAPKRRRLAAKASLPKTEKHKLVRSVAVAGANVDDGAWLRSKLGKELETELEAVHPLPLEFLTAYKLSRDGCPVDGAGLMLLVFKSTKSALKAVARLHSPSDSKDGLWARQVSGDGLHLKRWRLMVRNLPFTATASGVRAAFAPAGGFVWEVTVPTTPTGRGRGFAFVGFQCQADAQNAIATINGQRIAGRPVAVDWALSKVQFEKRTTDAGQDAILQDDDDEEEEEHEEDIADEKQEEMAPEEEQAMQENVLSKLLGGEDSDAEEKDHEDVEDESDGDDNDGEEYHDDEDEEPELELEEKLPMDKGHQHKASLVPNGTEDIFSRASLAAVVAQKEIKPALAAASLLRKTSEPAVGPKKNDNSVDGDEQKQKLLAKTVFVRGLPLDVSKDQVWQKFVSFGRLKACRLVMDKDTGKPKGTAFVEYFDEPAARAAAAGRTSRGPGIAIGGRFVDVDLALDRDGARAAAARVQEERKTSKEKRNLHLAKEGVIMEGSPAWEGMSASDQGRRRRAAVERKTKLASPNFVISPTRLSIRNIPYVWDEAKLKAAFVGGVMQRASKARPRIKQVKILRESDRMGQDGKPLSKGIGFVEFEQHEHALCALRELNNNPKAFTQERRPIVEFAIDNVKILKAREDRDARRSRQAAGQKGDKETRTAARDGTAKRSRQAAGQKGEEETRAAARGGTAKRSSRQAPAQKGEKNAQAAAPDVSEHHPRAQKSLAATSKRLKRKAVQEGPASRRAANRDDKKEAKLEGLISDYRSKLLGGGPGSKGQVKLGLKRWFE